MTGCSFNAQVQCHGFVRKRACRFAQNDQLEKMTFESLGQALQQHFTHQDHFRVSLALVMMIRQSDLLTSPSQRMVALYLLYDMFRAESIDMNPFVSVFVHLLIEDIGGRKLDLACNIPKLTAHEKYFVTQLLTMPSKDLCTRPCQNLAATGCW